MRILQNGFIKRIKKGALQNFFFEALSYYTIVKKSKREIYRKRKNFYRVDDIWQRVCSKNIPKQLLKKGKNWLIYKTLLWDSNYQIYFSQKIYVRKTSFISAAQLVIYFYQVVQIVGIFIVCM